MEEFSVKITVGLILIKDNKVLMLRRKNTGYMDGMYAFVAGHVERGESLKQAMIREAKEEAGIILKEEDLEYVCAIRKKSHEEYINFFFRAENYDGVPHIIEKEKCDVMKWIDMDSIPENSIDAEKRAIFNMSNGIVMDEYEF